MSRPLQPSRSHLPLRLAGATAILAVCSLSAPAAADHTDADKARAHELVDRGDQKAEAQDLSGALQDYRAAHAIMGVPTTGILVATTLASMGRLLEARESAAAVAAIPRASTDPKVFDEARTRADSLVQSLDRRIPKLRVVISGLPPGVRATLEADGRPVEVGLTTIRHDPGTVRLTARAPGHDEVSREVTLAESTTADITLAFTSPRAAGVATATPVRPATTSGTPALAYVGFGVGAAGLGVGAVSGLLSLSKASSIKNDCTGTHCPVSSEGEGRSATTLANISNVSFGLALVGVGVGLYSIFSAPKSPAAPASALTIRPRIGLGTAGIDATF